MLRLWSMLACIAMWMSGTACSSQVVTDSIPFEQGTDNRIYVKCRINDSDTLRFLFDTGATDIIVNPNSPRCSFSITFDSRAVNQGATGTNVIECSHNNALFVGGVEMKDLCVVSIPYPANMWDGVLGLSFIRRFPMKIDYRAGMIYLYDRETFVPPVGAECVEVEYVAGVPVIPVRVKVNGKNYDVKVEIDTGSDRVFDLNTPFVKRQGLLGSQPPFAISRITSSDSGTGELQDVFFDEVRIGSICLSRIPGAFSTVTSGLQSSEEIDGVLGNNFLQRFDITLDLENNRVYLVPNDLLHKPYYDFLMK